MFPTWSIFTAVTVLTVQLCAGSALVRRRDIRDKSCVIRSSAGSVVQRGSSLKVYCTFKCKCKGSMSSGHPPKLQKHKEFNSTTIYLKVVNITETQTYSCACTCPPPSDSCGPHISVGSMPSTPDLGQPKCSALDPCGLDILAGYPPDRPKNISCIYKVMNSESGEVSCTWNRGRDTYVGMSSVLRLRLLSGNHTDKPKVYNVSRKETDSPTASFTVSSSVQLISVWVQAQNRLGSAESITINYTLSDIAMPPTPGLGQPKCSSRECIIQVTQTVRTQHLEIQYRAEAQTWTSYPDLGVQMSPVQGQSISSLEPYRLYHFRARSKFSTGLWSQWSSNVSGWTQEEAPAKELDVWYAEADSDSLRVYWKELNDSIARGKITGYKVGVYSQNSELVFSANISADARDYSLQFRANCVVTLWACNSKGLSPPARITTHHTHDKPLKLVHAAADNHSVAISWRKPQTAPSHAAYVVEWYPEGHKLEELRWVRLGRNDNRAVITGIKPFECYEGAVHVVYNEYSVSRTRFTGVTTLESAPSAGPSVQEKVEGNKVKATWIEIPREQRGGCITNYTIYLEDSSGARQCYTIPASERTHVIKDLSPSVYSLWMTASTAKGKGPAGQKVKFFIQQETQLFFLLVGVVIFPILMLLLCVCQCSAVKQRFLLLFQCLKLDDVPDPANSKWAKECTQEKGKMQLQLQPSNSSVTEEEEPILVNVEELPKECRDIRTLMNVSSQLPSQTRLSPLTEPTTLTYPLTTYIKSFSQDSDSSDHTQTSLDTNTSVDYISSHGPGNLDEEDEEEFVDMLGFFPSHSLSIEPLKFGGKLTLDAVKIGGNDFFRNNF